MSNSAISFNTAGLASTTSPGLVGTGAQTFAGKKTLDGGALIKGDTSGVAIASGYVGEKVESIGTSATQTGTLSANLIFNTSGAPSLSLSAGTWLIHGSTGAQTSVNDGAALRLYDNTAASAFGSGGVSNANNSTPVFLGTSGVLSFTGANRTIYLYGTRNGVSVLTLGYGWGSLPSGHLLAVRIA